MSFCVQLGRLSCHVSGRGPIAEVLSAGLGSVGSADPARVSYRVALEASLSGFNQSRVSTASRARQLPASGLAADDFIDCLIDRWSLRFHSAESPPVLHAATERRRWRGGWLPTSVYRLLDRSYSSLVEKQAYSLWYSCAEPFSQLAHLEADQTLVHAAALERDGLGLMICGFGGSGKTTLSGYLLANHGWRVLADDLAIVDSSGTAWLNPKWVTVYPYNQDRAGVTQGLRDRLHWQVRYRLFGAKGVRRRVPLASYRGFDALARSAALKTVVCLQRVESGGIEVSRLSKNEVGARIAATLVPELGGLAQVLWSVRAAGGDLPSVADLESRVRAVVHACLAEAAELVEVRFSHRVPVTDLATVVLRVVEQ